jgi:hypothetical protein
LAGWTAVSGRDCGQADGGTIAQRRDGFQAHVAGALHGPLIILFEQQRPDKSDDGSLIGKIPTTSLRRLISPLRRSSGLVLWILARCGAVKFM